MRPIFRFPQPDRSYPLIHQAAMLSRAHMACWVDTARKQVVDRRAAFALQPRKQCSSHISGDFELYRLVGFLLDDVCSIADIDTGNHVADFEFLPDRIPAACCRSRDQKGPCPSICLRDRDESGSPKSASASADALFRHSYQRSRPGDAAWLNQIVSIPLVFSSAMIGREGNAQDNGGCGAGR